jgi:hypothetical protein
MDFSPRVNPLSQSSRNQKLYFMMTKHAPTAVATLVFTLTVASFASGQEGPGSRASGMGGAFVAVADDASAVYWNPAGLASGPVFNVMIDFGATDLTPGEPADAEAVAGQRSTRLVAMGMPPLGLSYYRLTNLHVTSPSPAVAGSDDRQEEERPAFRLTTSHFGVTLLQSVGGGVALATTLKLVRGSLAGGNVSSDGSWSDVLERVSDLEADGRTRADLDLGVMLNAGRVRLGLVARNLREPNFAPDGVDDPSAELEREVRVGAAWGSGWPGLSPLVVSFDADVTRVPDVDGERRDVAAGAETWGLQRRLGLRAGWRASTVGDARPVGTAGISIAVRSGTYIDAHIARGRGDRQSWSIGGRFTY